MLTTFLQPYRYGGLLPDGPRDRPYNPNRYATPLDGYVIADNQTVGPFNTGQIPGFDPDYPYPPAAPFPAFPPPATVSPMSGFGSVFHNNVFGGQGIATTRRRSGASLGGLFDFLDDEEVEAGDVTGATSGGAPAVKDATVIPGTASTPAKHSQGAIPKLGGCLKPYIDDPVNPSSFCILDPKGNYTCPANQIYDPVTLKCVPYTPDLIAGAKAQTGVICPYGTKAVGKACVSLANTTPKVGGGGGLTPPSPDMAINDTKNALAGSSVPTWLLVAAGVAVVGGIGVVAYKKSQGGGKGGKRKGGRR